VLLKEATARGIAAGTIDLVFRRWDKVRVKEGTSFKTVGGLVRITAVTELPGTDAIGDSDAVRAGFDDRAALLAELDRRPGAHLLRIEVEWEGDDPRVELARDRDIDAGQRAEIEAQLARWDRASRSGPWTERTLRLIESRPEIRAGDLAEELGQEKLATKRNVRKLKEIGLTLSLETGYRISPRGEAYLGG